MKHSEGNFVTIRDMSVYYQYWQPEEEPRALLLVVHGAGEHSGRYLHLAERFTARGYVVAALDHPNHGKSDGHYGHVERFDDFLQTLGAFHRQVSAEFPGLPQFLLGHSMGGLISSLLRPPGCVPRLCTVWPGDQDRHRTGPVANAADQDNVGAGAENGGAATGCHRRQPGSRGS